MISISSKSKLLYCTVLIVLILCCKYLSAKDLVLFDAAKNHFFITTSKNTTSEAEAAKMLQHFLSQQTKRPWPVSVVKDDKNTGSITITELPSLSASEHENYEINIKNNRVDIRAAAPMLKTSVAAFLERFTGCRVYADSAVYIPSLAKCMIPDSYAQVFKPAFPARFLFERSAFDSLFVAWHGISNNPGPLNHSKTFKIGLWMHTFFDLAPPGQYFQSHPEYFSLRNGKRVAEQLCLSNKAIVAITVANLKKNMALRPELYYWSVSQMDNQNFCECNNCKRIAAEENADSGPIVRFVNEVATYFPDKNIMTLAYQYSRKAPARTKCLPNVTVTVCSLESDRSKPLNDPAQIDNFAYDLKQWVAICKNTMVWDYSINFLSIGAPFPNLDVLQPNLQFFKKLGVRMVFEQGWHLTGSGLQDYRAYLISKLLWNPDINVDNVKADFFNGYYGKAGNLLIQVVDLMQQSFNKSGKPLSIFSNPSAEGGYLTESLREKYKSLISKALSEVADNPLLFKRVDAFAQAFRLVDVSVNWYMIGSKSWIENYTISQRTTFKHRNDSLADVFVAKAKIYGPPTMIEGSLTPTQWKSQIQEKFQKNVEDNRAAGAAISFKYPAVHIFSLMGIQALVDGSIGTDDWSTTWQGWRNNDIDASIDLKKNISIKYFNMRFMKDTPSDLVTPDEVQLWISSNGTNYRQIATIKRPVLNNKTSKEIVNYDVSFKQAVNARYMHVIAKCPQANSAENIKGERYLFSDEIYIR